MQFDLFWRICIGICKGMRKYTHKCICIEKLIILPILWLSQMFHLNFQKSRVSLRVRDELATPLKWASLLSNSGFIIFSLLTEICKPSCLFTTGFMASLFVWFSDGIQKGVLEILCWPFSYWSKNLHLWSMHLFLLFYTIYGWLGFFIQLLSLPNILPTLEFIYYGERKINVLKKTHKSGVWLYKIIIIFPVEEPGEYIYLFEFQIVLYIYTHTPMFIAFPLHIQCHYVLLSFLYIKKTHGLATKI